jgi:hypothetical protein
MPIPAVIRKAVETPRSDNLPNSSSRHLNQKIYAWRINFRMWHRRSSLGMIPEVSPDNKTKWNQLSKRAFNQTRATWAKQKKWDIVSHSSKSPRVLPLLISNFKRRKCNKDKTNKWNKWMNNLWFICCK